MTIEELLQRQQWPFDMKLKHTIGILREFIAVMRYYGITPYISYSGGKDSTVLLDIVRRFIDPTIKGVYCNTGNEYPDIVYFVRDTPNIEVIRPEKTVKEIISTCGFPLISKEVSQKIREVRHTKSARLIEEHLNGVDPVTGRKMYRIPLKWQYIINAPFEVSEKCCYYLKKTTLPKI